MLGGWCPGILLSSREVSPFWRRLEARMSRRQIVSPSSCPVCPSLPCQAFSAAQRPPIMPATHWLCNNCDEGNLILISIVSRIGLIDINIDILKNGPININIIYFQKVLIYRQLIWLIDISNTTTGAWLSCGCKWWSPPMFLTLIVGGLRLLGKHYQRYSGTGLLGSWAVE